MNEILSKLESKHNYPIAPKFSRSETLFSNESGNKATPCKPLNKANSEAGGRVLASGQHLESIFSLKERSAKPIAGGFPVSVFGESEGRSHAVLLEEEQVAGVSRYSESEYCPLSEGKTTTHKSASIVACEAGKWAMVYGKKEDTNEIFFRKFCCKSWRCSFCSGWVRRKDFSRMQRGFQRNPGQYVFAVLTFDPKKIGKKKAYQSISKFSNALVKKIERSYGKIVGVQAVEQHKSGYPHLNFVFKFDEVHGIDKEFIHSFLKRFLTPEAVKCGFGRKTSADLIGEGEVDKVLSYVSKTGLSIISGETNKQSQVPMEAPKGFRRLRSIRGFLKEKKRESEYTGGIVKSSLEEIGLSNDSMGDRAMIDLVTREFPMLSKAKSVKIVTTDNEKVSNFLEYKAKAYKLKTFEPINIDYLTGEIISNHSLHVEIAQ